MLSQLLQKRQEEKRVFGGDTLYESINYLSRLESFKKINVID